MLSLLLQLLLLLFFFFFFLLVPILMILLSISLFFVVNVVVVIVVILSPIGFVNVNNVPVRLKRYCHLWTDGWFPVYIGKRCWGAATIPSLVIAKIHRPRIGRLYVYMRMALRTRDSTRKRNLYHYLCFIDTWY